MARGRRWVASALAATICAVALSACDGGGSDGDDAAAAAAKADRAAAAAYGEDLTAWTAEVDEAVSGLGVKALAADRRGQLSALLAAPPELAAAEGEPVAEHEVATEIDERVQGIVAELRAYEEGPDRATAPDAYGVYIDHYGEVLDLRSATSDRVYDRLLSDLSFERMNELNDRDTARDVAKGIRSKQAYAARMAKLQERYPSELDQSTLGYIGSEIAWLVDFEKEYARLIRKLGVFEAQRGFHPLYSPAKFYFVTAINAAIDEELPLTRELAAALTSLGELAGQGLTELPESAPTVGDAYRVLISDSVNATGAGPKDRRAVDVLNGQLWQLYRLRELEQTPEDVYLDARGSLLLQVSEEPRSAFDRLIPVLIWAQGTYPGNEDEPTTPTLVAEMEKLAAEPVPPVLEPYRTTIAESITTLGSVADDIFADDEWSKYTKRIERALNQAAERLDAHAALNREIRTAIEATRPAGTEGESPSEAD